MESTYIVLEGGFHYSEYLYNPARLSRESKGKAV